MLGVRTPPPPSEGPPNFKKENINVALMRECICFSTLQQFNT